MTGKFSLPTILEVTCLCDWQQIVTYSYHKWSGDCDKDQPEALARIGSGNATRPPLAENSSEDPNLATRAGIAVQWRKGKGDRSHRKGGDARSWRPKTMVR